MAMDLNEVAIFVKVIQAGSFHQAAKLLDMPNSTVSAKISSLEKRLGVTLLHRTTRKLQITEAGQAFFNRSLNAIQELQGAEAEVTSTQSEPQGHLRITVPAALGSSLLPDVLALCFKKYPKLRIELIFADRMADLIAEGIDLAIRAGELSDSSLVARKLGVGYFAPFASPGYLKNHGTPNHPKDLFDHACLQFTHLGKTQWELVSKGRSKVTVPMNGHLIADDLNLIKDMALAGQGIALLPTFICETDLKKNKLVRILPDWRSDVRPISFVYPPQKFVNQKLKAFIETATDLIKMKLKDNEI